MNRTCNTCNIEIEESNYLKGISVCKICYNKNRRRNHQPESDDKKKRKCDDSMNKTEKPKIDNVNKKNNVPKYENQAYVVIGPRSVGKTYYMLKVLEKIGNKRPIQIITTNNNEYPNCKTSSEIKSINKYKGSVVIFDDMLGARNSSQIDEFFTRGRHEVLDVYYISQSYFALPRQSIGNDSDRLILFKQTLGDVQSMYYDIGAYDMKFDEFRKMCHKACHETFNYLCIDMTKNKNEGKYRHFNESKTTYFECICETEAF